MVVPPGLGQGEISIRASIGGMQTQNGLVFSLQGVSHRIAPVCVYTSGDGGGGMVAATVTVGMAETAAMVETAAEMVAVVETVEMAAVGTVTVVTAAATVVAISTAQSAIFAA